MLSDQILKEILQEWSFWDSYPPTGIQREITLPEELHPDLALLIQGVRRCGKSTLLTQLPAHYQLPLAQCYYCNFEDPRLLNELNHTLLSHIVSLARKTYSPDYPCYFFFDEIQHVAGWEKWLHVQFERPKQNYFTLTGSNSCLLSGEYATALTGRHITLKLFPFSWNEFKKVHPTKVLSDYLTLGGFPKALTVKQPYPLLQEYFNDIILRDVLRHVQSRTPDAIKHVAKMTFDTCGSQLSYRKIAAVTGLTVDTVKSYLEACEQAYLLFACPYFAFSEKKRLIKQKKYYPIDPGLRYAVVTSSDRDKGKHLELLLFLHLIQRSEQVYYWEETHQGEVDFVTLQGSLITPYQVSWEGPQPRHEKALQHFYEAFPQANESVFITKENAEDFFNSTHHK